MEKKYISANRYKKSSSEGRKRRSENISKKIKAGSVPVKEKETKARRSKKSNNRRNKKSNKLTVVLIIIAVLLILVALRLTTKNNYEPFFNVFGIKVEDKIIESLDIVLVDSIDLLDNNSKNVVLSELNNYVNGVLLKVTDKYEIEYELLDNVEKESNKSYVLKISNSNSLTASVLNSRISSYKDDSSKYYANCKNIQSIEEINSKTVRITLKEDDPLFVYNLQLPINFSTTNTGIYSINTTRGASNKVTYLKKDSIAKSVPKSIIITTAKNDEEAIETYKTGAIDMFFTDSYDISEKLGKTDADIRSYLNGQCLFLFGNTSSDIFSKKEVRQAIAYSIDREKIRRDVYLNSGTIIDIPEIYSESKYKYDIYAAQNILLASGYTMQNSRLIKDDKYLEITMLVNKEDDTKVNVATYIKEDLESIGITVNLKLLTEAEVEMQIELENYDLVLADVSLNENPSISFIQKYLNVSDVVNKKLKEIDDTKNIQETIEKVSELLNVLSDEVACIGIHADSTYIVSKKGLDKFSNVKYMNIFSNLLLTNK